MRPTYVDGDKVIVNKISKQITDCERYDVIVFETRKGNYKKRVIGLPGEPIAYKENILYVNREPYVEPYLEEYKKNLIDSGTLTEDFTLEEYTGKLTIPDGYVFVAGDNRRNISDSRVPKIGLIPIDKVLGKANVIFYPLDNIGILK